VKEREDLERVRKEEKFDKRGNTKGKENPAYLSEIVANFEIDSQMSPIPNTFPIF
jgi:hypothetical protein